MSRILRYALNKTYTICNTIRGMKVGKSSMLHYASEIWNRRKASIGRGSVLYKRQSIYIGKKGRFIMGNDSHIAPYGYLLIEEHTLSIGNDVAIGPYCSFFCSSNSPAGDDPLFRKNYEKGDIHIGNNVFIGAQSIILPGSKIGDNSVIAANAVVKGELEGGWLYAGSPCKPIKKIGEDD